MKKYKNIIKSLVLSLGLVVFTIIYDTSSPMGWQKYKIVEKIIIYSFPFIALIIITYLVYRILNKPKKLLNNKKKNNLFIDQIFNGVSLCFFVNIIHNYMWPLSTSIYKDMQTDIMWNILLGEIKDVVILSLLFIAICLVLVSLNRNINEYLRLITYSEIIIIPLLIIGFWYFFEINPSLDMHIDYMRTIIYMITEYSLRILNISLPLIFYLKLSKNNNKKIQKMKF